jgi:hypothetical protein
MRRSFNTIITPMTGADAGLRFWAAEHLEPVFDGWRLAGCT